MCNSKPTQQNSSTSSTTPAALSQLQDIYSRISGAASTPYTPYTGELTAGLTDQQKLGISNVNTAAGSAQPYYGQAANYATQAGATISPDQIQKYSNPYTQSVINATQRQFNEQNGQQQQQVLGNAASRGALGGDRSGVAQAILAGQQQTAQAPVIAGMNQQNYTQALQAAQADRGAAGNAASLYGNLGTSAQNAAMSGAQAQIGAGTLQQQTNQAANNANYGQFMQQQAFPYQQAQFLASLGLPAASAMGSNSNGTTSQQTNPWSQVLGLGTAALTAFSDERVKEDIEPIGKTFDGQKIYKFRYKGHPRVEIGLMAQDVERKHPFAVGEHSGIKTVNYDHATAESAERGHFASGGSVFGDAPSLMSAQGYIPAVQMGHVTPLTATPFPSAQSQGSSQKSQDGNPLGSFMGTAAKTGMDWFNNNPDPGSSSNPLPGLDASDYGDGFSSGGFAGAVHGISRAIRRARGGVVETTREPSGTYVPHFDDGGAATFDERFYGDSPFRSLGLVPDDSPIIPDPGLQRVSPEAIEAWRKGVDQPNPVVMADAGASPNPMASAAPAPTNPMRVALPPQITGERAGAPDTGTSALGYAGPPTPLAATPANQEQSQAQAQSKFGSFNPFGLSDNARQAIISGGLGMASSRNPNILGAIGEGGVYGIKAYTDANKLDQETADKKVNQELNKRRVDQEAQRIAQSAEQFSKTNSLAVRTQNEKGQLTESQKAEIKRHEKLDDPEYQKKLVDAKRGTGLSDTAVDVKARQMASGDLSGLTNIGRGAQAGQTLERISNRAAEILVEEGGMSPAAAADHMSKKIQEYKASGIGKSAEARTAATREANLNLILKATDAAIPAALEASKAVARTGWVPINKIIQGGQVIASNPELREFGMANLQLAEHWARAMNPTGVMRESDRDLALHFLSTADSPETYERAVLQLKKQVTRERDAVRGGPPVEPKSATPSSNTSALPPASQRETGKVYDTPKGKARWMGNGWQLVQ